ncbi:hypothetical protein SAMN05216354_0624 [Xylanibacter ruminicola]|uniref:Molecular chaperone DnaJ n=1 Tax=Xylanibacter ruminicola TaxID=839 RepID=A0A1H5SDA4_XYLRU|nr:hypothetical protein SAMN05216354_0624 [Xylanibacter ruminicola]
MIKKVKKSPKVTLCRECGGTGYILGKDGHQKTCRQCEGSGRCVVSCEMQVNIEPYKPKINDIQ